MTDDAHALSDLIRAAGAMLARAPDQRSAEETGLALTALGLAERVLAGGAAAGPSTRAQARDGAALRTGAPDTRRDDSQAAFLHAALEARARARLAAVNPRYLEVLAGEEAAARRRRGGG